MDVGPTRATVAALAAVCLWPPLPPQRGPTQVSIPWGVEPVGGTAALSLALAEQVTSLRAAVAVLVFARRRKKGSGE
jgi:hypothetical protein